MKPLASAVKYTRDERLQQITTLIARGMTHRQAAHELGLSVGAVRSILHDPDGTKQAARQHRYVGTCEDCGKQTKYGGQKTPARRCAECHKAATRAAHGTRSRYNRGCRCDLCRAANTAYALRRRKAGQEPPTHSASGYINYGCRCDICKKAHSDQR